MNKTQKKFIWYAVLAVFVLLAVLLGILNAISFTMAAQDADQITQRISEGQGSFDPQAGGFQPGPMQREGLGPMGPDSPELRDSMRYFTCVFDAAGQGRVVSYRISAVTQQEALEWAASLRKEGSGWTHGTYRYRVWTQEGQTYVTVVDQGRELLAPYRILLYSVIALVLGTVLSFGFLRLVGRRLFAPIEEADRKQKRFIADAEQELKLPLTVISADTVLMERQHGPSEQTRSIHRQVRSMSELVGRLGSLAIYDKNEAAETEYALSELVQELTDKAQEGFTQQGLSLETRIQPGIRLRGSPEAMESILAELLENCRKYARSRALISLEASGSRIRLLAANDAQLPEGAVDQVFDRFTLLSNAREGSVGLGLAGVKEKVLAQGGRVSAKVEQGWFTVTAAL